MFVISTASDSLAFVWGKNVDRQPHLLMLHDNMKWQKAVCDLICTRWCRVYVWDNTHWTSATSVNEAYFVIFNLQNSTKDTTYTYDVTGKRNFSPIPWHTSQRRWFACKFNNPLIYVNLAFGFTKCKNSPVPCKNRFVIVPIAFLYYLYLLNNIQFPQNITQVSTINISRCSLWTNFVPEKSWVQQTLISFVPAA